VKRALLVLLAACGGEEKARVEPAGSGSAAPPKETITAQLAGCSAALAAPTDPRDRIAAIGTIGTIGTGYGSPIRSSNAPRVVLSTPSVDGDLDAALVRRILRRHAAKFLYCFEKQVAVNPKLAGGVVEAGFAIQSSGAVASPRADGIDLEVSRCIVNALGTVRFPPPRDGNQVQVTAPIRIEYQPSSTAPVPSVPSRRPVRTPREWTPFAGEPPLLADADAAPFVELVTGVVRERLASVEHCFDGARGAVRAMIAIDPSGRVESTRAGGIGDSAIERCIATAVSNFTVTPPPRAIEVACDFTRGGAAPLRVSPDAGYTVVELTGREMRNRTNVRDIPPRGTPLSVTLIGTLPSVLIVAEPDAPGHGLEHALWWVPAGTTLVAVKASGGAPVFLGMGDSRAQRSATTDKRVVQLRTDNGRLRACIPGEVLARSAPLLEPRTMDAVLAEVVAACQRTACEPTVVVGTSGEFIAKDLVATTSAARRAGFQSISIGGPACDP